MTKLQNNRQVIVNSVFLAYNRKNWCLVYIMTIIGQITLYEQMLRLIRVLSDKYKKNDGWGYRQDGQVLLRARL